MKPTVIVWDLETVPDLAGFAAANDLVGKRRGPRGDWREVPEAYLPLDRLRRRLGGGRRRRALSGREDGEGAHHAFCDKIRS